MQTLYFVVTKIFGFAPIAPPLGVALTTFKDPGIFPAVATFFVKIQTPEGQRAKAMRYMAAALWKKEHVALFTESRPLFYPGAGGDEEGIVVAEVKDADERSCMAGVQKGVLVYEMNADDSADS
ncbi:MAG: hypothetical protein V1826_00445 [bacterium]